MIDIGNRVPDFTTPLVEDEIKDFTLANRLKDEAPIVFAFFPGPFTKVCSNEMVGFHDNLDTFEEVGATVYGVHTDTPMSLKAFKEEYDLNFGLLSDTAREVVEAFDVRRDFEDSGLFGVPDRAVFIVDNKRKVTYAWNADDPANEPDYEEIQEAARTAA